MEAISARLATTAEYAMVVVRKHQKAPAYPPFVKAGEREMRTNSQVAM
jgi:hypothetical protein